MKIRTSNLTILFLLAAALLMLLVTGCQKETIVALDEGTNVPSVDNQDVALSVAGAIGEDGGGALDQVGDLMILATPQGAQGLAKEIDPNIIQTKTVTYDSLSKTWTVMVERQEGTPGDSIWGTWSRTFTHQYRNQDGIAQKFYITDGDTAYSIAFNIITGTGEFHTPRRSHQLKSISGAWVAANTNTDMITVNGTFQRAALDSIFRLNGMRISDHSLNLDLTDVTGPRGSRRDLSRKVSGSISGTFHADMQLIINGETWYRTVDRDIDIQLGNGEADINVGGEQFTSDPKKGEII